MLLPALTRATGALLGLSALFLSACSSGPETVSLFEGADLRGWHADVPDADGGKKVPASFEIRDGMLISNGSPGGHLITDASYRDYRLVVEYRWLGEPGNCGVLVHSSTPRRLYGMFPQSIEVQMHVGNAGDFWCIGEDITVPDMESRRGPKERWGVDGDRARRIANLTDGGEKAPGEWNTMVIECRGREIVVFVNGVLVNHGTDCTAAAGQIALQAEGAPCEFRGFELEPLVAR
jgi:hypothetical protein